MLKFIALPLAIFFLIDKTRRIFNFWDLLKSRSKISGIFGSLTGMVGQILLINPGKVKSNSKNPVS